MTNPPTTPNAPPDTEEKDSSSSPSPSPGQILDPGNDHGNPVNAKLASSSSSSSSPSLSPWRCYFSLFSPSYVPWHYTLGRAIGLVAALIAGATFPVMALILGDFVTEFNAWARGQQDADSFKEAVAENAHYLIYLFVTRFLVRFFAPCVSCGRGGLGWCEGTRRPGCDEAAVVKMR